MSSTDYDVGLFEMISGLIREQHELSRENRRGNPRHPYECVQLLAFYDGEHLPGQGDFRQIACHDLSRCGFSFFAEEKPEMKLVLAALGRMPVKYYVAEILHAHQTVTKNGIEFQIGCRFLRRLENAG